MEKWWMVRTEREESREDGGMHISFLKKIKKRTKEKYWKQTEPWLWNTARHFRSVSHTRNTSKRTDTHHPEPKPINKVKSRDTSSQKSEQGEAFSFKFTDFVLLSSWLHHISNKMAAASFGPKLWFKYELSKPVCTSDHRAWETDSYYPLSTSANIALMLQHAQSLIRCKNVAIGWHMTQRWHNTTWRHTDG